MSKAKNLNNSSIKTKVAIKKAFESLLNEKKDFEKIKVNELCTFANINRGTFYLHYDNIYDVAEEYENELVNALSINDIIHFNDINGIFNFLDNTLKYIKDNEETYKILLTANFPQIFLTRVNKLFKKNAFELSKKIMNDKNSYEQNRYFISFFADGMALQVVNYFINNENNLTLDQIFDYNKEIIRLFFYDNFSK